MKTDFSLMSRILLAPKSLHRRRCRQGPPPGIAAFPGDLHHARGAPPGERLSAEAPMSTMKTLDLTGLDLRDALDLAVLVEEEAKDRYEELAAQMENQHTFEAAAFFHAMVKNEAKHGEELAARRKTLSADAPRRVDRSLLWDVEA